MSNKKRLTQKDLTLRWECSMRTVQRYRKEYELMPVGFLGSNPLFDPSDVEQAEKKMHYKGLLRLSRQSESPTAYGHGILPLKTIRAKAKAKAV
jgi:hypothetical protein